MKPVSHIASSSSRPPMLSRLSMESENRVLPVVRQVPQRQSIIPRAGLRASFNSDILIARAPVALITILIPVFIHDRVLMTTVVAIDSQRRISKKVPRPLQYTFSNYSRQKQTRANETWHFPRSLSRLSKNMLKNIRVIKCSFKNTANYTHSDTTAIYPRASLLTIPFNK